MRVTAAALRINGSQVAQVTTDQGTGNYGSNVLFIGRRNNAEFPFNGKDYGIVFVGKAASRSRLSTPRLQISRHLGLVPQFFGNGDIGASITLEKHPHQRNGLAAKTAQVTL